MNNIMDIVYVNEVRRQSAIAPQGGEMAQLAADCSKMN